MSDEYLTIKQHEEFAKRIDSDIAEIKADVREIKALSLSVERLTISMVEMQKELEKQHKTIAELEAVPGENWKKATWEIIKYVIILCIGIVAVKIGVSV